MFGMIKVRLNVHLIPPGNLYWLHAFSHLRQSIIAVRCGRIARQLAVDVHDHPVAAVVHVAASLDLLV